MDNELQIISKTVRSQSGMVKMMVSLFDGESLLEQTVMSIDDYISLLQGAVRRVDAPTSVELGLIPQGLYDGFVTNRKGTLGGIFYIPPQKHQFILAPTDFQPRRAYYLPMPGLVYSLIFNNECQRSMSCFAFKEWKGDDTVLYQYPFGNVSSSGSVCMGSIKSVKGSTFMDLREHIENSLNGVTSGDYLGGQSKVRLATDATQYQFCDSIAELDEFPMELLLESEKMATVGNLRRDFFKISRTL